MPVPSPFHPCTSAASVSHDWREWSGYLAASTYEISHEREYYAIRNSAALIDVSPLFKYEFRGPDAERALNRILPRDVSRCRVGQVLYSPWCDDDGKVIDDGTIQRLSPDHFRVTAADPSLRWFQDCSVGLDVDIEDVSEALAALAIQGPSAETILASTLTEGQINGLGYYGLTTASAGDIQLTITRTGFTGDRGYELWLDPADAVPLWEGLMRAGDGYGLMPAGMVALDIARIEAGLLLIDVDYISAQKALIEAQKSSPYEIGLGWTVDLEGSSFVGRRALRAEKMSGSAWRFVGLEVSWPDLEALFGAVGLPPLVAGRASRHPLPIYRGGRQIGQATSNTFSPILKKYIAMGVVERQAARLGDPVEIEVTVEYSRERCPARLVRPPFYAPPHKKS